MGVKWGEWGHTGQVKMDWNLHHFLTTSKLPTSIIQVSFRKSWNPLHGAKHTPRLGFEGATRGSGRFWRSQRPYSAPCKQGEWAEKKTPVWTTKAPEHILLFINYLCVKVGKKVSSHFKLLLKVSVVASNLEPCREEDSRECGPLLAKLT